MARRASPARLVIALGVAAMLAIFLVYTAIAGGTPQLRPSELKGRTGEVSLVGKVVGKVSGDARRSRLRFRLRVLKGRLHTGTFVGTPNTLSTKCPSKYVAEKKS